MEGTKGVKKEIYPAEKQWGCAKERRAGLKQHFSYHE